MDSICEILINVVMFDKPKMLTGLAQKGMEEVEELSALLS